MCLGCGGLAFQKKVLGNLQCTQNLNLPKSLNQGPAGASGSDSRQSSAGKGLERSWFLSGLKAYREVQSRKSKIQSKTDEAPRKTQTPPTCCNRPTVNPHGDRRL